MGIVCQRERRRPHRHTYLAQSAAYGIGCLVAENGMGGACGGKHRTECRLDGRQMVGSEITNLVAGAALRQCLGTQIVDHLACVYLHRARRRAEAVAGTALYAWIFKLLCQRGKPASRVAVGTETADFALHDNALARRQREAARQTVALAEAALDTAVYAWICQRQWLYVLYVALRIVIENDTWVQQPFRVKQRLHTLHHVERLLAPLQLDKRSHVAACAVLCLKRAVVFVHNEMLNLLHQRAVTVNLLFRVKRLRDDKMIVAFKGVAVDAGIVEAKFIKKVGKVGGCLGKVLDVERNVLDKHRRAERTRSSNRREDSRTDCPIF